MIARLLIGLILVACAGPAFAAKPAILQKVTSDREGDSYVVELLFDKPVKATKENLEFINQTVQLNIKGASVNEGKVFTEIEDEKVKSLYTYQLKKDLMRTRVIHHKAVKAADFKEHVEVATKKNRLIMTLKDPESQTVVLPAQPPVDLNAELEKALGDVKEDASEEVPQDSLSVVRAEMEGEKPVKGNSTAETRKKKLGKDEALAESEIPVLVGDDKKEKAQGSPYFRMLMSLGIVLIIAIGAFVFSRKWSKRRGGENKHGKIKVLTQHHLGPKKSLAIVRVAGESILIGITDQNISMLKSLSLLDEDLPEQMPMSFDDAMEDIDEPEEVPPARASKNTSTVKTEIDEEEFSMGRIKDMVSSKLKEMRTL